MRELVFLFSCLISFLISCLIFTGCENQSNFEHEIWVSTVQTKNGTITEILVEEESVLVCSFWRDSCLEDEIELIESLFNFSQAEKLVICGKRSCFPEALISSNSFTGEVVETTNLDENTQVYQNDSFTLTSLYSNQNSATVFVESENSSLLLVSNVDSLFLEESSKKLNYKLNSDFLIFAGETPPYSSLFLGYNSPQTTLLPSFEKISEQQKTVEMLLQQECHISWLELNKITKLSLNGKLADDN